MRRNPMSHVDATVDEFIDYVPKAANAYRTNNVAITIGKDFHYFCNNFFWVKFLFSSKL